MLCENIRRYRQLASMSQKELAFALGVTQSTIAGWETGRRTPDMNAVSMMADVLGVSLDVLAEKQKEAPRLSSEEEAMLSDFRLLTPAERRAVAAMIGTLKEEKSRAKIA